MVTMARKAAISGSAELPVAEQHHVLPQQRPCADAELRSTCQIICKTGNQWLPTT